MIPELAASPTLQGNGLRREDSQQRHHTVAMHVTIAQLSRPNEIFVMLITASGRTALGREDLVSELNTKAYTD
jgi:hypothetical protein